MKTIDHYFGALKEISTYFGWNSDIPYAIDDSRKYWWHINDSEVTFYDSKEAYNNEDDMHTYGEEIYGTSVFHGPELTAIVVWGNGEKYMRIFDNSKKLK